MSNCTENILSYVRGNDVLVDLRFFENVMDGEQVVEQPFDLTMCDEVRAKVYDAGPIDYGISRTVSNSLVLRLPRTIPKGKYSLEIIALRGGMQVRSFDMTFHVVGTNREACSTLATSGSYTTTSFRITFRMVPQALVRGKSAYELWRELPGNEDKELQDYLEELVYDDTEVRELIRQALANFANYYSREEVTLLLSQMKQFDFRVAAELPSPSAETMRTIWLVPSTLPATSNTKDEFITIADAEAQGGYRWEFIGRTTVDLSAYSTTAQMNAAIAAAIRTEHAGDPTTADVAELLPDPMDDEEIEELAAEIAASAARMIVTAQTETVVAVLTSDVPGVSVEGLTLNVYYNGSSHVSARMVTDAQGMASMEVPRGYTYRVVFPQIAGCKDITAVQHTASVAQRSIEAAYVAEDEPETGTVRVVVADVVNGVMTVTQGVDVTFAANGTETTVATGADGIAEAQAPYGVQATVTVATRSGKYARNNQYSWTFVMEQSVKVIGVKYYTYQTGLFIVDSAGQEWSLDDWKEAVAEGVRINSDGKLIKVTSGVLVDNGGVFAIDIDMVRERTQGANKQWCPQNVQFNSIPLNGNSASAACYYDGLTASRLVQAEGDERGMDTPAADACLAQSRTVGGVTLPGFLGSTGQWVQLWLNVAEIDEILQAVRPQGTYLLSTWTTQKWTITQNYASIAYYWGTTAINGNKSISFVVLPFFAY